jgi:putative PEP-CTERM system TPR-repeat lipoprotein
MSHNLLAAAYIGKKDLSAARQSLEKALELQPGYTPAATNLAQLDLQDNDPKAARKRFEDILAKDRKNVQAYVALAGMAPQLGATSQEVRGWLEAAHKASPESIQPLVMLARLYFQANEPKKAMEVVERAVVAAPDNVEVLELAGQVQLAAGEKNRALTTFSKWVTAQPHSATALYRMATAQLANEDLNGAINSLGRAVALRPEFAEAQTMLADLEARAGRSAQALRVAAQMQQQNAKSPGGWIVEGDVLMREKRFAGAAKAYEKAFSLHGSAANVIKLHTALAQDGRAAEGESRLREWLKKNEADVPTRLYLAETYLKGANFKKAIEEYELLLLKLPENLVVLNNLAWCYQQTKDARAVPMAERALKLKPDNPAVMDTLGWILVERGDVQRGVELLKKAVALAPKAAEIRFHYAQGLVRAGDKLNGKQELERLLTEFPQFPDAAESLKLLAKLRQQ